MNRAAGHRAGHRNVEPLFKARSLFGTGLIEKMGSGSLPCVVMAPCWLISDVIERARERTHPAALRQRFLHSSGMTPLLEWQMNSKQLTGIQRPWHHQCSRGQPGLQSRRERHWQPLCCCPFRAELGPAAQTPSPSLTLAHCMRQMPLHRYLNGGC